MLAVVNALNRDFWVLLLVSLDENPCSPISVFWLIFQCVVYVCGKFSMSLNPYASLSITHREQLLQKRKTVIRGMCIILVSECFGRAVGPWSTKSCLLSSPPSIECTCKIYRHSYRSQLYRLEDLNCIQLLFRTVQNGIFPRHLVVKKGTLAHYFCTRYSANLIIKLETILYFLYSFGRDAMLWDLALHNNDYDSLYILIPGIRSMFCYS